MRRGDARLGGGFLLLAVNHRGPRERPKSIQFLLEVHIQCLSHSYVTTGHGVHSRGLTSALQASRKEKGKENCAAINQMTLFPHMEMARIVRTVTLVLL